MKISILNAGQPTDYLYGIVSGLTEITSVEVEVVDSDKSVGVIDILPRVTLFNLRGDNLSPQSSVVKAWRIGRYYLRLFRYAARTQSKIFHIQWENSLILFDRTFLILYYKLLGKKLVITAHNIYKEARDGRANLIRWLSLKIMYSLVDRIIVHTPKMKEQLFSIFHIPQEKVVVIPHGINIRVPNKGITREEARRHLGLEMSAHVVLFFGWIDEYKGVHTLIDAVADYVKEDPSVVLIIAGKPKRPSGYILNLKEWAMKNLPKENLMLRFQFIPVDQVEDYFTAADCLVLPYKRIFQSGVLFLAYRFGLPTIAADVGSFRNEIIDGVTGLICKPDDPKNMSAAIRTFFNSELFHHRDQTRALIKELAERKYSWTDIGKQTFELYKSMVKQP